MLPKQDLELEDLTIYLELYSSWDSYFYLFVTNNEYELRILNSSYNTIYNLTRNNNLERKLYTSYSNNMLEHAETSISQFPKVTEFSNFIFNWIPVLICLYF